MGRQYAGAHSRWHGGVEPSQPLARRLLVLVRPGASCPCGEQRVEFHEVVVVALGGPVGLRHLGDPDPETVRRRERTVGSPPRRGKGRPGGRRRGRRRLGVGVRWPPPTPCRRPVPRSVCVGARELEEQGRGRQGGKFVAFEGRRRALKSDRCIVERDITFRCRWVRPDGRRCDHVRSEMHGQTNAVTRNVWKPQAGQGFCQPSLPTGPRLDANSDAPHTRLGVSRSVAGAPGAAPVTPAFG